MNGCGDNGSEVLIASATRAQVITINHQQVSVNRMSVLYIIITATAGALVAMTTMDAEYRAANGLSTSILLIYTIYTLLTARRLFVAAVTGSMLTILHIVLSTALSVSDPSTSSQASIHRVTVT